MTASHVLRPSRVDLVLERFRQLQDLELKILLYSIDIKALMVGMTEVELAEIFRRQPLLSTRFEQRK